MGMTKSKLKKRLRKKHHVGEFQEMCFEIKVQLKANISAVEFDKFVDDFILQAIEKNQLVFGGGGNAESWTGFASSAKKFHSPNDKHKEAVRFWLEQRAEVIECEIGDFRDAWHGWD